jgi:catechol 2,3-dioxygenase-like lactoylglutathione lyase family enzyme
VYRAADASRMLRARMLRASSPRSGDTMSKQAGDGAPVHRWYARPVFFVADLRRAIDFYVGRLGFVKKWHADDGAGSVCQVDRSDCEIILCEDATRTDRARLFVELTAEGLAAFRGELAERGVASERIWWGYDTTRVADPDGNELYFPEPR